MGDGVVELSYTLDHVGPLACDVQTVARMASTIADGSTTADFVGPVTDPPALDSLALGVPEQFFGDYLTETVERTIIERIDELAAASATVQEVSIPLFEEAVQTWNAIVNVEFATFLEAAATPLFRRGQVDASLTPWRCSGNRSRRAAVQRCGRA